MTRGHGCNLTLYQHPISRVHPSGGLEMVRGFPYLVSKKHPLSAATPPESGEKNAWGLTGALFSSLVPLFDTRIHPARSKPNPRATREFVERGFSDSCLRIMVGLLSHRAGERSFAPDHCSSRGPALSRVQTTVGAVVCRGTKHPKVCIHSTVPLSGGQRVMDSTQLLFFSFF